MPSSSRGPRSASATLNGANSASAFSRGRLPPMQAPRIIRPCETWSSAAHWAARKIGSRRGKVERQQVPSRTRRVRAAMAESSTSDSSRGLANRLSPTQTESKAPEASAASASSISSSTLVAPNSTPRLGRLNPKRGARRSAETSIRDLAGATESNGQ